MSKMFMNVKEVMEVLEVSESYAYKLMKRLNRELQAMGCQTIAGKVDRKYFYEQFYGTSCQGIRTGPENVSRNAKEDLQQKGKLHSGSSSSSSRRKPVWIWNWRASANYMRKM